MSAQPTEAPPRAGFDARVLGKLRAGCEAAPEIAHALRASTVEVGAALERLRRAGDAEREDTPTFRYSRRFAMNCFRYRVTR